MQRASLDEQVQGSGPPDMPSAPGELAPRLEAPWRQLRLLVAQLAGGFGVLVAVAVALFLGGARAMSPGLTRFVAVLAVASVLDVAAARFVLRRYLRKRARAAPEGRSAESAVAGRVATAVLVVAALVEAPGLLGVVMTIAGAPAWVLGMLVALSVVGFVMLFPTRARYVAWAAVAEASRGAFAPPLV